MIKQARKQKIQGGYSKYSLFMNILCRNSSQFTVQSKNCHVTATIPWEGNLKFRIYNPRKISKYVVLVRTVCEALSGYICKMEIYAAEGQKLEETVLSLLDRNLGNNHHNYQENFYNTVR
jgi:hypothetical protein